MAVENEEIDTSIGAAGDCYINPKDIICVYFFKLKEFWAEFDAFMPCPRCGCDESKKYVEHFQYQRKAEDLCAIHHRSLKLLKALPCLVEKPQEYQITILVCSVVKGTIMPQEIILILEDSTTIILVDIVILEEATTGTSQVQQGAMPGQGTHNVMLNIPHFIQEQYRQIIQLLGKESEGNNSTITTPLPAGMTSCVVTPEVLAKWIVDSGASSYMVHSLGLLVNPKRLNNGKNGTVQLPTGNAASLSHIGSTYINQGQTISNVLHILDFNYNLLYVSKLTKEMRWAVMFFPEFCIFQELSSGQVKGIGREDDGLYIFYSAGVNTTDIQAVVPRPIPRLSTQKNLPTVNMITKNRIKDVALWHKRFGHVLTKTLKTMNIYSAYVKVFRSDNGSEFLNSQGGCVTNVVYIINRLPSTTLQGKSLFEALIGHVSPLDNMRVFGCLGYVTDVRRSDKFAPRAVPAYYLLYVSLLDLNNPIIFSENKLPPYHVAPNVASPDDAPPHNHSESDTFALYEDDVESYVDPLAHSVVIPAEPIFSILAIAELVASRRSSRDSRPPIWLKDYMYHCLAAAIARTDLTVTILVTGENVSV
ncbi:uncharacterized protein LOC107815911 [Nicotiana tabacum]|uniref:Uncharacterized protein LOC107815911 n=1 Tax=Nicotiana tabacum TaxID=4097 RepID=A0AC58SE98_TOBAC